MYDVTAPGRELHRRFIALGDLTGRTADEIIAALRVSPSSISTMADGAMLLQWQATGCHMALLFEAGGKFVRITHQYANYEPVPAGCSAVVAVLIAVLGVVVGVMLSLR